MSLTLVVMAAGLGSRFGGTKQLAQVGPDGEAIGMGMTNYNTSDLNCIKGLRSSQIFDTLGHGGYGVAIHRDAMVIWDESVVQPES